MYQFNNTILSAEYKGSSFLVVSDVLIRIISTVWHICSLLFDDIYYLVKDLITQGMLEVIASGIHKYEDIVMAVLFGGNYV
jgi:hypothetical protein